MAGSKPPKVYTLRPLPLLPPVVLNTLGSPRWVRQGTVGACAATKVAAGNALRERGIHHSPREMHLAMGNDLDAAIRAGLLAEPDTVVAALLDIRIDSPVVSVSPEGVTVLGHWRLDGSVPSRLTVEPVSDPADAAPATEQA